MLISKHATALCVAVLLLAGASRGQLSKPVATDADLKVHGNKFLQRQAEEDSFAGFDLEDRNHCPQNVQLRWMTEVSSSVYATPLITDLYSDGRKEIIVPSFVHYLEALEGPTGAKALGWPAFHKSTMHTSPLLYDADFDGIRDILVATYNGEILFFKDTGEQLPDKLQVPLLSLRRHWYAGLKADYIDHSHPDVGSGEPDENPFSMHRNGSHSHFDGGVHLDDHPKDHTATTAHKAGHHEAGHHEAGHHEDRPHDGGHSAHSGGHGGDSGSLTEHEVEKYVHQLLSYRKRFGQARANRLLGELKRTDAEFYETVLQRLRQADARDRAGGGAGGGGERGRGGRALLGMQEGEAEMDNDREGSGLGGDGAHRRRLMQAGGAGGGGSQGNGGAGGPGADGPELSKEAADSFHVFDYDDVLAGAEWQRAMVDGLAEDPKAAEGGHGDAAGAKVEGEKYDELGLPLGDAEQKPVPGHLEDGGLYDEMYDDAFFDDFVGKGAKGLKDGDETGGWDDERFWQDPHISRTSEDRVSVDPHILCTPAIADIDGDGNDELVVAVTYFFDKDYYDDPQHKHELGGADPTKYVAGGIVVFDLRTKLLKWQQHLDLSTDTTTYRAYMYSSPTLVDLDADGRLEVVVGTSMGFLYVLGSDGRSRDGWPIQMGEIQGQPLVADLNGDGKIEIFAADTRGSVALFNINGEEIWERHLRSMISQNAAAADVDGDFDLEIVFGTASGHVYALSAASGTDIRNFPFRTRGKINAPVLPVQLQPPAQQLVVMSFDGHLYIIDGVSGCADSVDIGESSYSMVLADDLDGNGRLDLVVATMNGVVYCFETPAEYHPLKTWPQQVLGANGMVARHEYYGVHADASSRRPRDIAGDRLQVRVTIVDRRSEVLRNGSRIGPQPGPYNVSVVLKGVGVQEMKAGPQPVIGVADKMDKPGTFTLDLPAPRTRTTATVHIEMQDRHGLTFVDEFPLSFHMHFHKLLKWFITLPLAMMVTLLLVLKRDLEDMPTLPSFHYGREA